MSKRFTAKLGNMRKAVDWIVYPPSRTASEPNMLLIQSDKRICQFDKTTGEGVLSASHNYPSFVTLQLPNATKITVPPDVIALAEANQYKSGDRLGSICTIA